MSTIGDVLRWQGIVQFFDNSICTKCGKKIKNGTHGIRFLTRVGVSDYALEYCMNCGAIVVEENIRAYESLREEIKSVKKEIDGKEKNCETQ